MISWQPDTQSCSTGRKSRGLIPGLLKEAETEMDDLERRKENSDQR